MEPSIFAEYCEFPLTSPRKASPKERNIIMKKSNIMLALVLVIITLVSTMVSASAEDFAKYADVDHVAIQSNNDHILGVYYNAKIEISSQDTAEAKQGSSLVKSKPAKGNLASNRLNRKPRYAELNLNDFSLQGKWIDEKAYTEFNGDVQALFNATLVSSQKKGKSAFVSHLLWDNKARKVTTTVFYGYLGGRKIKVTFILKDDGTRQYGIELLEQTVLKGKKPSKPTQPTQPTEPTQPTQPEDQDPEPVWEDPDPVDTDPEPVWEDQDTDPEPVWEDDGNDGWDPDFNF